MQLMEHFGQRNALQVLHVRPDVTGNSWRHLHLKKHWKQTGLLLRNWRVQVGHVGSRHVGHGLLHVPQ